MNPLYFYKGKVNVNYDGDTITDMTIDLGFGVLMDEEDVRFYGIDTFEMRDSKNNKRTDEEKAKAIEAKLMVEKLTDEKDVIIRTFKTSKLNLKDKKGKYGRWLARVFAHESEVNTYTYADPSDFTKVQSGINSGDIAELMIESERYFCINDILVLLNLATEETY